MNLGKKIISMASESQGQNPQYLGIKKIHLYYFSECKSNIYSLYL